MIRRGTPSRPVTRETWEPVRPRFDDPASWSLPLGRVAGVSWRLHALFLGWIVIEIARAVAAADVADLAPRGPGRAMVGIAALVMAVVLHELGHRNICRRLGGSPAPPMLWPLGGLTESRPPRGWRAAFLVAAGGPLAGIAVFLALAPILWATTGVVWSVAIPVPPFEPALGALQQPGGGQPWWLLALFEIHRANFLVLLLNLLPLDPLDGAAMLRAVLGRRCGPVVAARSVGVIGIATAIVTGAAGAAAGSVGLVALAVLGGFASRRAAERIAWTATIVAEADGAVDEPLDDDLESGLFDAVEEPMRSEVADVPVGSIDAILAKISREGMASLDASERATLEAETERRRANDPSA